MIRHSKFIPEDEPSADESIVIETDLTEEERSIIAKGMAEYEANPDSFVPLSEI